MNTRAFQTALLALLAGLLVLGVIAVSLLGRLTAAVAPEPTARPEASHVHFSGSSVPWDYEFGVFANDAERVREATTDDFPGRQALLDMLAVAAKNDGDGDDTKTVSSGGPTITVFIFEFAEVGDRVVSGSEATMVFHLCYAQFRPSLQVHDQTVRYIEVLGEDSTWRIAKREVMTDTTVSSC